MKLARRTPEAQYRAYEAARQVYLDSGMLLDKQKMERALTPAVAALMSEREDAEIAAAKQAREAAAFDAICKQKRFWAEFREAAGIIAFVVFLIISVGTLMVLGFFHHISSQGGLQQDNQAVCAATVPSAQWAAILDPDGTEVYSLQLAGIRECGDVNENLTLILFPETGAPVVLNPDGTAVIPGPHGTVSYVQDASILYAPTREMLESMIRRSQ